MQQEYHAVWIPTRILELDRSHELVVNQHNGKYPGSSLHAIGTTDLLLHIPEIQSHAF
jgi:hypothetical protein